MTGDVFPGVQAADLEHLTEWIVGAAMLATAGGVVGQRLLARRSVGLQIGLVVMVTVVTAVAAVGVISVCMFTGINREVMLELMGVAGLAGLAVALVIGRSVSKAAGRLLGAVRQTGQSGIYAPPAVVLPAELAGLSRGFSEVHEQLGQARAREQALEASRRELVAWVSHDLRTPLAGLRAMAEALEDHVVTDPREVSRYHSQIRTETERLATMIDDLFQLSKIHAGALRLSRQLVGLEDLVAEVAASATPVARAKGVWLTGGVASNMAVLIDPAEFSRAVSNLVVNAIRHTSPGGAVELVGEIRGGFAVAFRGESARTPDPSGGAGLGLSIARGIVEEHGGDISVRNTGPGCRFMITLPLARPAPPAVSRPAMTGPILAGRHTSVSHKAGARHR